MAETRRRQLPPPSPPSSPPPTASPDAKIPVSAQPERVLVTCIRETSRVNFANLGKETRLLQDSSKSQLHQLHNYQAGDSFEMTAKKRKAPLEDKPTAPGHVAGPLPPIRKKPKVSCTAPQAPKHPVLGHRYAHVLTLRQYVLARLPSSSRLRRKKIRHLGSTSPGAQGLPEMEAKVSDLLDRTLVGLNLEPTPVTESDQKSHREQSLAFSQPSRPQVDDSRCSLGDATPNMVFTHQENVNYAIWLLFEREKKSGTWPQNLLCDGFRRGRATNPRNETGIRGLYSLYPNNNVQVVKDVPWPQLLVLLGRSGHCIMRDLLLGSSIFVPVHAGHSNLLQVTGKPLHELNPGEAPITNSGPAAVKKQENPQLEQKSPSEITLVRSRMFYARPAFNSKGLVHFGLRHIHVLNRCPYVKVPDDAGGSSDATTALLQKKDQNIVKVMMYIFPRQFGLHNAFTSQVDFNTTTQKFQDYTFREEEIAKVYGGSKEPLVKLDAKIPKRLRGSTKDLVEKLQKLHSRCSYSSVLHNYCPIPPVIAQQVGPSSSQTLTASGAQTQKATGKRKGSKRANPKSVTPELNLKGVSMIDLATPESRVSAFCQAIISRVVPDAFWGGNAAVTSHNKGVFLRNVDHLVRLRQFESLSLHEVIQGMKVVEIPWLTPPKLQPQSKISQSDRQKRTEIFYELLYYLFDSFLIPLIRSNFYVTESSAHKYKIFFFRHDVWKHVAEPAMRILKSSMFEEIELKKANFILESRKQGFSQVRLLPKANDTMRPLMNLKRRVPRKDSEFLEASINSILQPVQTVLKYEKGINPDMLGSSMFSVGEMYPRLKAFKCSLPPGRKLFFVKVDVKAAFDTIPQEAVVKLLKTILLHQDQQKQQQQGQQQQQPQGQPHRPQGQQLRPQGQQLRPHGQQLRPLGQQLRPQVQRPQRQQQPQGQQPQQGPIYKTAKYITVKPPTITITKRKSAAPPKLSRKWLHRATSGIKPTSLLQDLEANFNFNSTIPAPTRVDATTTDAAAASKAPARPPAIAASKSSTIFVDSAFVKPVSGRELVDLAGTHIQQNIVKIGKKYYRQKKGISQGSVLSTTLCNYFYGDLEKKHLGFIHDKDGKEGGGKHSLLMRLIDDFLLITTDRDIASRFVQVMHDGVPEYGVTVNPVKSLVNFPLTVNGVVISMVDRDDGEEAADSAGGGEGGRGRKGGSKSGGVFPYCGTKINMTTLELSKDRGYAKDTNIANALTIDYGRVPGQNFQRKVLASFYNQGQAMFFDTSLNSPSTILSNLHSAFTECANKMWAYARCFPKGRRPGDKLVTGTITKLTEVAFALLTSKSRKVKVPDYRCDATTAQVSWLAAHAFREALSKKRTHYQGVLAWLDAWIGKLESAKEVRRDRNGVRTVVS